ncbi:MAG: hypothetical protein JWL69_3525 [Phycisphaerales bacterium]|nr:hypothetical protein [Phycisphaerales bacterium]MDB5356653.1 hypothetical protein [Phycisphaerales bacterium]
MAHSAWSYFFHGTRGVRPILMFFWYFAISTLSYIKAKKARIIEARKAAGACLTCGYDLTGNVGGTCPECGRKVG